MTIVNKAFKVRIYPNKKQKELFAKNFGSVRLVYNEILERMNYLYKYYKGQYKINRKLMNTFVLQLKREYSFLKDVESTSLQQASHDLMNAFNMFFKNPTTKLPKFKSKKKSKDSFRQTIPPKTIINDNRISLRKYGSVRFRTSKKWKKILNDLSLKVNNITISLENSKYYISINTEYDNKISFKKTNKNIGFDVNSNRNGVLVDNYGNKLKFNIDHENQMIKKLNKMMSRTQQGSRNFNRIKNRLHKQYDKRKNKLNDLLHKYSRKLVEDYDTIVFEKNCTTILRKLCKSEQNVHFPLYGFLTMLEYKFKWYKPSGKVAFVDPKNTSRTCSICGSLNDGLKINQRKWVCRSCGVELDRDSNAAQNILNKYNHVP